MFTITNLIKTILVSALISLAFVFYESTSAFQQQIGIHGNPGIGRIDALLEASKTMEAGYFWFHLAKQWFMLFSMLFVACAILLMVVKPSNK